MVEGLKTGVPGSVHPGLGEQLEKELKKVTLLAPEDRGKAIPNLL